MASERGRGGGEVRVCMGFFSKDWFSTEFTLGRYRCISNLRCIQRIVGCTILTYKCSIEQMASFKVFTHYGPDMDPKIMCHGIECWTIGHLFLAQLDQPINFVLSTSLYYICNVSS